MDTVVPLKWAQHKKIVFLTLEAKNLSDTGRSINLTPEGHLHFEGTNKVTSQHYKLDLDLFDEVIVELTKWKVTDYSVQFSISKKKDNEKFWPRLTKENKKSNFITVDWAHWVDEDEAEEKGINYNPEEFDDLPEEGDSDDEEEAPADLDDLEGEKKEEEEKKEPEKKE
ncbi:hypothetical protein SteCoe_7694 [Stentor coeruleus]|uniref:CS domain-containing protein n=1 Tax=Stentor coeruleus TaxID=5963 RepID=A0A1R2CM16_9CILI|nr:hypothetical protein SteCoe_7694 [Stentor coeruleus]